MAQVNSAGKQAQDYSEYYKKWRVNVLNSSEAEKFLEKFGLSWETAIKLNLGIDYNSNPRCLPWKKSEGGMPRLIVPVSPSYYIGIAPETVMKQEKGVTKNLTVLNSNGSTVTPFYPPFEDDTEIFWDFTDRLIFVVNDIRDMLALTELGILAVSLNGNGGVKKFKDDAFEGCWDNSFVFCAKFNYSGEHNKAWEKMENLKKDVTEYDERFSARLLDFSGKYDSIYERFKAERDGLKEDITREMKCFSQDAPLKMGINTAADKLLQESTKKYDFSNLLAAVDAMKREEIGNIEPVNNLVDNKDSEHEEMARLMDFVDRTVPESRLFIRIPNELAKDYQEGWRFKAEGLHAGVPDYFFAFPSGPYSGLWLEMKRKDGGTLSPEQERYVNILTSKNFKVAVCHGADEAIAAIVNYLAT